MGFQNINFFGRISFLIQSTSQLELLATFSNADTVKTDTEELKPDVILMDIDMPGTNGIDAVAIVKAVSPKTQVIMLTVFDDNEKIFSAIYAGASGYILKRYAPLEIPARILVLDTQPERLVSVALLTLWFSAVL